jgi:Tfp pilus assembly protein PilN
MTEDPGTGGTTQVQPAVQAGPKPVTWAPVPKVNLLPIEIVEGRAFRRTQVVLAGAVVLVVGVIAVGTVVAKNQVDDAQAEADAAQLRVNQLQQQQIEFAEVPKIYAQVEAATAARKQAYIGDAPWYRYIRELDRALPAGVEFSSISMTLSTASATAVSPLVPAATAALTVSGTAPDYKMVAEWMEAFDKVRGLQSVTLQSATKLSSVETDFSATGVAGSRALSGRYQKAEDTDTTDQNSDRSNSRTRSRTARR